MAGVQDIEAAVREADRKTLIAPARDEGCGLVLWCEPGRRGFGVLGCQFVHDFGDIGGRGAKLADDDTGGGIGDLHGGGEASAAGMSQRQSGDDRVPGARDVEHFAGASGNGRDVAVAFDQGHAAFGAGDQNGFGIDAFEQRRGGGGDALLGPGVDGTRRGGELAQIGGDAGGAGVAGEIGALGIDKDRQAAGAGGGDRAGEKATAEHAFAVVREDDGLHVGEMRVETGEQRILLAFVQRRAALLVGAHDLLPARKVSGLADGRPVRRFDQGWDDAAAVLDEVAEPPARRVAADKTHEYGASAERSDVAGNVPGTPEHFAGFAQQNHGHGCFGGDPLDISVDETIKHDVARAQHSQLAEIHVRLLAGFWRSGMPSSTRATRLRRDAPDLKKAPG